MAKSPVNSPEFNQIFMSAWVESRMEFGRQQVLVSTLALGLLSQYDKNFAEFIYLAVWLLAVLSFMVGLGACFWALKVNSPYIDLLLTRSDEKRLDTLSNHLERLNLIAAVSFLIGVGMTLMLTMFEIPAIKNCFGIQ